MLGLSLGPGLGQQVVSGGGAAWTPASLPGLLTWIEADPTKLYTDAGTTLVSADGQSVYRVVTKDGNARLCDQPTLANRPLYKTNGTQRWLQFDGSASTTRTNNSYLPADGSGNQWAAVCVSFSSNTGTQAAASFPGTNSNDLIRIFDEAGTARGSINNTVPTNINDDAGAITAGTPCVIIVTVTPSAIETFLNNVSNGSTAITGTVETSAGWFTLGAYNSVTDFMGGNAYLFLQGSGTLSSADRANIQTYGTGLHP